MCVLLSLNSIRYEYYPLNTDSFRTSLIRETMTHCAQSVRAPVCSCLCVCVSVWVGERHEKGIKACILFHWGGVDGNFGIDAHQCTASMSRWAREIFSLSLGVLFSPDSSANIFIFSLNDSFSGTGSAFCFCCCSANRRVRGSR